MMTREEFNAELRRLHPDTNGGDHSKQAELEKLITAWQLQKRKEKKCACGCGRLVPIYNGFFFNMTCKCISMARKRMKSKKLKKQNDN